MASDVVRCPSCGIPVEPSWDWCQNCNYDPVHLKPPDWTPPVDGPPAPPAPVPAAPPAPAVVHSGSRTATAVAPAPPPPAAAPGTTPGATPGAAPAPAMASSERNGSGSTPPDQASDRPTTSPVAAPGAARQSEATSGPRPTPAPAVSPAGSTASTRRRTLLIAAALVAAAAVVIWLAPSLGRGASTAAQERRLNAKLLSVSDLPQGWRAVPPSSDVAATSLACLTGGAPSSEKVPVAAAGFGSPAGVPNLVEVLEGYSTAGASRRFDQLTSLAFHGCPTTTKPSTSTGIGQTQIVVLPLVGDQSAAVSVPTTGGTTSTVVVARMRGTVMFLEYETHGPPDTDLLQLLAIRASAKVARTA